LGRYSFVVEFHALTNRDLATMHGLEF